MNEYDVTIIDAGLAPSKAFGLPGVALVFSPNGLYFRDGRMVSKLFCRMPNVHPNVGWRRAQLRCALGEVASVEPFTDEGLSKMVGRRLRVCIEEVEFEGVIRLRVTDFSQYLGEVEDLNYADSEYVFMMRKLAEAEG